MRPNERMQRWLAGSKFGSRGIEYKLEYQVDVISTQNNGQLGVMTGIQSSQIFFNFLVLHSC